MENQALESLVSKVLHDLAAPLSGLYMGVDMLEEFFQPPLVLNQEISHLIQHSLQRMRYVLESRRLLLGAAWSSLNPQTIRSFFEKFYTPLRKVAIHIGEDPWGQQRPSFFYRCVFGLLLMWVEASPRGGSVNLVFSVSGSEIESPDMPIPNNLYPSKDDPMTHKIYTWAQDNSMEILYDTKDLYRVIVHFRD